MRRKEVNIFSMSFLDLLSGALAAVIILFIVVPKMDAEAKETKEIMQELDLKSEELQEMVTQLENSVDESTYNMVADQLIEVEQRLASAKRNMQSLQNQLNDVQSDYSEAQNQVGQLKRKVDKVNQNLKKQKQATQTAEQKAKDAQKALDEFKIFGVEADLAIICKWTAQVDVDIYLYSHKFGGWCYFEERFRRTRFGELLRDQTQATNQSYEMIYQPKLVEGRYDLYMNIYKSRERVLTNSFIIIYPGTPNESKLVIGDKMIQGRGPGAENPNAQKLTFIKSFTVSSGGVN